jgi:hypothetical protein
MKWWSPTCQVGCDEREKERKGGARGEVMRETEEQDGLICFTPVV